MPFPRKKPAVIGTKAAYPGFIEPVLATTTDKVPAGQRWLHEIKFDGYRVQVHLRDAAVKVFTRRGNDWTNRFPKIAADAWNINAGSAIIDGEVVVPAANGTTDFSLLQNELKGRSKRIVMVAFDLLYLNGYDLRRLPLFERKALLKKIIFKTDIQFSAQRETLAIAGFALDGKKWDGIYLGRRKGKELIYAGKVDHGFDTASAKDLQARLKPLIRKTQPYAKKIAHRGIWVEPSLLAEVEYRAKSPEGTLRHPFFKGIPEDL
jgi:bifunctional non-homologous end joining protein LigD